MEEEGEEEDCHEESLWAFSEKLDENVVEGAGEKERDTMSVE